MIYAHCVLRSLWHQQLSRTSSSHPSEVYGFSFWALASFRPKMIGLDWLPPCVHRKEAHLLPQEAGQPHVLHVQIPSIRLLGAFQVIISYLWSSAKAAIFAEVAGFTTRNQPTEVISEWRLRSKSFSKTTYIVFSKSTYIVWSKKTKTYIVRIKLETVPRKLLLVPWQLLVGDQPLVEEVVGGADDVLPVAVHHPQHEVALSVSLNEEGYTGRT